MGETNPSSTAPEQRADVAAVILRLQPTRYPYVCASIARSLGRMGVDVFLLHADRRHADARSRWLRGASRIPPGTELVALERLARNIGNGSRPVLIAVDDPAALFIDEHAEELSRRFLFPRVPRGLVGRLSSKAKLHELCTDLALPTPAVTTVDDRDELRRIASSLTYPTVLKVVDARQRRTRSVAISGSPRDLVSVADEMMAQPTSMNLLLQEYIPASATDVWIFNGYFAQDSTLRFGGSARKLRQYPTDAGVASLGVCEPNARIYETTVRLARETSYVGPIDLDFRYDARDTEFKLVDVNPRIGTSFRLFVDPAGLDIVQALYLDLLGRRIKAGAPVSGRKWIVENYDLRSAASAIAGKRLTVRAWIRSLGGLQEAAWYSRDDMAPFAAMLVDSFADLARLAARGFARWAGSFLPLHVRRESSQT